MPDAFSLGFDTSAAHCAAALLQGDRLLAQAHEDMARGQAERLFPLLGELLAGAGVDWRDLSVIGCGTGPGNFTGIRISVAAARGLSLSLGVPAVGVTVTEAMAHAPDQDTTTDAAISLFMIFLNAAKLRAWQDAEKPFQRFYNLPPPIFCVPPK